jgi:hypothetical protein
VVVGPPDATEVVVGLTVVVVPPEATVVVVAAVVVVGAAVVVGPPDATVVVVANTVVEVDADLVTFRYEEEDDEADERMSWEVCVRLDSIGAVSTRLATVNRLTAVEDLTTTGECPEAERLGLP